MSVKEQPKLYKVDNLSFLKCCMLLRFGKLQATANDKPILSIKAVADALNISRSYAAVLI